MKPELKEIVSRYQAVIFDMDGTLVDSMWVWEEIDHDFFHSRGMEFPDNLHKEIEGMSFTETAEYFVKNYRMAETVEEVKNTWNRMAIEKYRTKTPLKPGALSFLRFLKENGIRVGIATSNSNLLVDVFLKARGLESLIDAVTTSCDVNRGKPAPDVYLTTAEKLNVIPERCLVFEDLPMGILAGKNAGMRTCAVEDSYSADLWEEKKRLADYSISDFTDVIKADVQ